MWCEGRQKRLKSPSEWGNLMAFQATVLTKIECIVIMSHGDKIEIGLGRASERWQKNTYTQHFHLNNGHSIIRCCGVDQQHHSCDRVKNPLKSMPLFPPAVASIQIMHCLLHSNSIQWCAVFRCGLNGCCRIMRLYTTMSQLRWIKPV